MDLVVYNVKVLYSCFCYTDYNINKDKYNQFIISRNEMDSVDDLYNYLKNEYFIQIGYNNLDFSYPVLHYFIKNFEFFQHNNESEVTMGLFEEAKRIIESNNSKVPYDQRLIKQLDLCKIWGYHSHNRIVSLNDIKFNLNMDEIHDITSVYESYSCDFNEVMNTCKNDVQAIFKLLLYTYGKTDYPLYKGVNKIRFRNEIKRVHGVIAENLSDSKIAENLFISKYCNLKSIIRSDIYKSKINRDSIKLSECIPANTFNFKTEKLNTYLTELLKTEVNFELKNNNNIKWDVAHHDIMLGLGMRAIEASARKGIYKADEDYDIINIDIRSAYPTVTVNFNYNPEHLDSIAFNQILKELIKLRFNIIDDPEATDNYKFILNNIIGRANSFESCLFDQLFYYKVILTTQLIMLEWFERLSELSDIQFIMINTDEITFRINKKLTDKAKLITNDIFNKYGLKYKVKYYSKLVFLNYAEYLGITVDNKIVDRGVFKLYKELNMDNSCRIIPYAIQQYFINGIKVSDTIKDHKDIKDFLIKQTFKRGTRAVYAYCNKYDVIEKSLGRIVRYYVSESGGGISVYKGDKPKRINEGVNCETLNIIDVSKDINYYRINYNYYISKANEIIFQLIMNPGLILFD